MRIHVDRTKCRALGVCESITTDYFEVGDEGELVVLQDVVAPDDLDLVEKAVVSCPTGALSLTQE